MIGLAHTIYYCQKKFIPHMHSIFGLQIYGAHSYDGADRIRAYRGYV